MKFKIGDIVQLDISKETWGTIISDSCNHYEIDLFDFDSEISRIRRYEKDVMEQYFSTVSPLESLVLISETKHYRYIKSKPSNT